MFLTARIAADAASARTASSASRFSSLADASLADAGANVFVNRSNAFASSAARKTSPHRRLKCAARDAMPASRSPAAKCASGVVSSWRRRHARAQS